MEYLCGGYFGFAQLPRWDLGIMGAVKKEDDFSQKIHNLIKIPS